MSSECFEFPSVPVNPLLRAMFMWDIHAYAKRAMESMQFIGQHPRVMIGNMLETGIGYEMNEEEWKDVVPVIDDLLHDFGSGGVPILVTPDSSELANPLALHFDDQEYGLTERVTAFVGICAPDFEWSDKQVVTAIYRVLAAMGYSIVQMRALREGRIGQMARLVVDFDWRGNHSED